MSPNDLLQTPPTFSAPNSQCGSGTLVHPANDDLEEWHLEGSPVEVGAHVARCAECQRVIASFEADRWALLDALPAHTLVAQLRARLDHEREMPRTRLKARVLAWPAMAVATAAAFVLSIQSMSTPLGSTSDDARNDVAIADNEQRPFGVVTAKGTNEPVAGLGMALVLDRGGTVTLHHGPTRIVPGDRLRVKLASNEKQRVSAGLLTDEGEWISLFEGELSAGYHAPASTLLVDQEPTGGRLLFGPASDVVAVRRGATADRVQVIRLEWRETP